MTILSIIICKLEAHNLKIVEERWEHETTTHFIETPDRAVGSCYYFKLNVIHYY